jgi:hypothetical protein
MKDRLPAAFAIGVVVVAVAVGAILFSQRNAAVGITGNVLKVRTAPLDEKSSVAVVDFRFTNPSDVNFVVGAVTVAMEDPKGGWVDGQTISEVDAKRMFEMLPLLGQKFNDTLVMREKFPSRMSADRMVAARFEIPEEQLTARKRFLVKIEEVDGKISEISEK